MSSRAAPRKSLQRIRSWKESAAERISSAVPNLGPCAHPQSAKAASAPKSAEEGCDTGAMVTPAHVETNGDPVLCLSFALVGLEAGSMSKSKVEVYEQIPAQDPSSTDFVNLAKTLIDQGNHLPAIDVCRSGLEHHPNSILGRVLWGRALIHLGRPAEAMEQFDRAIDLGRENPHTYGLISEVLLQRGLYRSALPLLKKAVLLQPSNGRWRGWFEETQRALAGGAPPRLAVSELSQQSEEEPSRRLAGELGAPPEGEVGRPPQPLMYFGEAESLA